VLLCKTRNFGWGGGRVKGVLNYPGRGGGGGGGGFV